MSAHIVLIGHGALTVSAVRVASMVTVPLWEPIWVAKCRELYETIGILLRELTIPGSAMPKARRRRPMVLLLRL